jgi:hypothetical protein
VEINGTWYDAPEYDFEGGYRPFGAGYDIGADEYDGDGYQRFQIPGSKFQVQSYPNPFSNFTTIEYELEHSANVNLSIYNHLGQRVADLVDGTQVTGTHQVQWDAEGLPTGIYYYRLSTANCQLPTSSGKIVRY